MRSADVLDTLSWDTLDTRRSYAKSVLMYKVLNDHTAPGLRNSFVRRSVSQNTCNIRNNTTDLTLLKPKREFLKRTRNIAALCFGISSPMKRKRQIHFICLKIILGLSWITPLFLVLIYIYIAHVLSSLV